MNTPLPLVVHSLIPVPEIIPFSWNIPAQTDVSLPAKEETGERKVAFIISDEAGQFPFPVVVTVNEILPSEISDAAGTYIACIDESSGEKFPLPDVVQIPPSALLTSPFSMIES